MYVKKLNRRQSFRSSILAAGITRKKVAMNGSLRQFFPFKFFRFPTYSVTYLTLTIIP